MLLIIYQTSIILTLNYRRLKIKNSTREIRVQKTKKCLYQNEKYKLLSIYFTIIVQISGNSTL